MLLSFENVSFSYHQSKEVLRDITFNITDGEKVALLGLNGAGKSTLLLHTNGLLLPSKGRVLVEGSDTRSKNINEIRKKIGLVFQNPDDQLFMPTVWDDVAFGPQNMKLNKDEIKRRVNHALEVTNTLHLAEKSPFQLSGGQKKAVSIATVLSMDTKFISLDEPTSGLDYEAVNNFISIINKLPQACLISTHDMEVAKELCTRAIVIKEGQIVYDGNFKDVPYPD